MLEERWGFIDGKNLCVQKRAMHNGWLHATFITGVLCFGVDDCIVWGKHNYVGFWNDGDMSQLFQEKLCNLIINVDNHGVLADSDFPVSGKDFGRIITPLTSINS